MEKNEILYSPEYREGGLKNLKIDICRNCLLPLKDAQNYDEVMGEDSKNIIAAVQVLLDSFGYDVGKIDGFLVTKGQKTSKTMEAIKKFQKDRGITPVDGLPGPRTIRELCDYCDSL